MQDHPEAVCYKTKIIENWGDLPLICEKNRRPTRKSTDPETETGNNIQVEDATAELDNSHNTSDVSLPPVDIDFSEQEPFIEQQQQQEQLQQEEEEQQHQHQQQQLPTTNGVTPDYLHSWPKLAKKRSRVGDAVVSLPAPHQLQFSDGPLQRSSAKKIFGELSIVKGLQEWQLLQIYDLFIEDERKFESFMALPNHLRKPWVLMQIRK